MRRPIVAGNWKMHGTLGEAATLAAAVVAHRLSALAEEAPEALFVVERGDSLASVARKLEDAGLVRDARAVVWLARLRGLSSTLRAGEYRLSAALPPGELLIGDGGRGREHHGRALQAGLAGNPGLGG